MSGLETDCAGIRWFIRSWSEYWGCKNEEVCELSVRKRQAGQLDEKVGNTFPSNKDKRGKVVRKYKIYHVEEKQRGKLIGKCEIYPLEEKLVGKLVRK